MPTGSATAGRPERVDGDGHAHAADGRRPPGPRPGRCPPRRGRRCRSGRRSAGTVCWNWPQARSSDCRIMKLWMVVTGSGSPATSIERRQEPPGVGRHRAARTRCHSARMSGVLSMTEQGLGRHVDRGRLDLLDGVAGVGQRPGCLANPVLHLFGGALAGRVDDEGDPEGLGGFGAAQRCRHRPRVAPGGPGQHLEGGVEVGDPARQRALDGRQLDADRASPTARRWSRSGCGQGWASAR